MMQLSKWKSVFFNRVVDVCIESLHERFETLSEVQSKFGVLTNFPKLTLAELQEQCGKLSSSLSANGQSDLDGNELASEMQSFPDVPKDTMTILKLLCYVEEKKLKEIFPNLWVALRVAATAPVTVASAERSFSKLKLIKNYLRSTMTQDRLNGLAMMSINRDVSRELSYDDIINDFAAKKSRRVKF